MTEELTLDILFQEVDLSKDENQFHLTNSYNYVLHRINDWPGSYGIGKLINGKKEGVWKLYCQCNNHRLSQEVTYSNDLKHGPYWDYRYHSVSNPIYDEEGSCIKSTLSEIRYLYRKGEYVLDKEEGIWRHYYEDGTINAEGQYILGKKEGIWRHFYKGDRIISLEGHYVLGKEEGIWRSYHDDGTIDEEGQYILGKKEGLWKSYYCKKENHNILPSSLIREKEIYENNQSIFKKRYTYEIWDKEKLYLYDRFH